MVTRQCEVCGKSFRRKPSEVALKHDRFCSLRCWAAYLSSKGSPKNYVETKVNGVRRPKHVVIAENIIGRKILNNEPVHHIDGNRRNNEPRNLCVCDCPRAHKLLHSIPSLLNRAAQHPAGVFSLKIRAVEVEGTRLCTKCLKVKPLEDYYRSGNRLMAVCILCKAKYFAARRHSASL